MRKLRRCPSVVPLCCKPLLVKETKGSTPRTTRQTINLVAEVQVQNAPCPVDICGRSRRLQSFSHAKIRFEAKPPQSGEVTDCHRKKVPGMGRFPEIDGDPEWPLLELVFDFYWVDIRTLKEMFDDIHCQSKLLLIVWFNLVSRLISKYAMRVQRVSFASTQRAIALKPADLLLEVLAFAAIPLADGLHHYAHASRGEGKASIVDRI